jgi:hypothetical protein
LEKGNRGGMKMNLEELKQRLRTYKEKDIIITEQITSIYQRS